MRNVIATHQPEGMPTLEVGLDGLGASGLVNHEAPVGARLDRRELEWPLGDVGVRLGLDPGTTAVSGRSQSPRTLSI